MIHIPDDWDPTGWPLPPQPQDNEPLYLRDGGRCAYGVPGVCLGPAQSVDHRIHGNRADRRPSNLISACGDGVRGCHGWKEANPAKAAAFGWTLTRHGRVNPAGVAVFLRHAIWGTGWFVLGDDLTVTPTTPPEDPDAT